MAGLFVASLAIIAVTLFVNDALDDLLEPFWLLYVGANVILFSVALARYRRSSGKSLGVYVAVAGIPLIALTTLMAVGMVLACVVVLLFGSMEGLLLLPFAVALVLTQRLEVHSVRFLLREARGSDGLG